MSAPDAFEGWAILEIMGHRRVAGFVRQVSLFGAPMARIDIPALDAVEEKRESDGWVSQSARPAVPAFTQFYGGAAVFSMSLTTEEVARAAARRLRQEPPREYVPPTRQISPLHDDDIEDAEVMEDGPRDDPDAELSRPFPTGEMP